MNFLIQLLENIICSLTINEYLIYNIMSNRMLLKWFDTFS